MWVGKNEMKRLGLEMLKCAGFAEKDAETIMHVLIDTGLRGIDSHSVRAIPIYIEERKKGLFKSADSIRVVNETLTTSLWDTKDVNGFVVGTQAMEQAIEKAKKYKVGAVGCIGPAHNGALYWYANLAVKHDMVGIVLQRGDGQAAAPYGGIDGRLGTNPFAIGIPTSEEKPILLDMATNAVATGHFHTMTIKGENIPQGWLINKGGEWVTEWSSEAVKKGMISPVSFGGVTNEYKGYGIKIILEALVGGLCSGGSLDARHRYDLLYIALDPSGFCSLEEFKARIDSMIRHVKSSKTRPGFEEVYLPGEKEYLTKQERMNKGIFLDDSTWEKIAEAAKNLGLDLKNYKI